MLRFTRSFCGTRVAALTSLTLGHSDATNPRLAVIGSTADASFVRCIKPNAALTPNVCDESLVLHQLR